MIVGQFAKAGATQSSRLPQTCAGGARVCAHVSGDRRDAVRKACARLDPALLQPLVVIFPVVRSEMYRLRQAWAAITGHDVLLHHPHVRLGGIAETKDLQVGEVVPRPRVETRYGVVKEVE